MRNYLIFNGRDSREFGVYISGQGTFSAPQKAYTFYNIPGRNGALIGYDNRFENINVSYDAFICRDFDKNIAAFRSFLLSVPGYAKLEDSYHPDEFRVASYVGPFEPTITSKNDAGSFTITFNCKPQRYLKSGEQSVTFESDKITLRGEEIYAYGPSITNYFHVRFDLTQEGSGQPTPTNPRPIKRWTDLSIRFDGEMVKQYTFTTDPAIAAGSGDLLSGSFSKTWGAKKLTIPGGVGWLEDIDTGALVYKSFWSGIDYANAICSHFYPHSEFTPAYVGQVEENTFEIKSNGNLLIWTGYAYSDAVNYINQLIDSNEIYFAAQFSTPVSISESAFSPDYPASWFNISANAPMIIRTFAAAALTNPTEFDARPIIRFYGNGTLLIDGITITVNSPGTYTDIDCELMDCYEGGTNRNQNVTFSTYDFPVLHPGNNTFTSTQAGGLIHVEIVPRWWRL